MIHDLSESWPIKGTDESTLAIDSSVPLMHMVQTNLGSLILILIQITPNERSLNLSLSKVVYFVRVCNPRMDKMIDVVHTTPGKIENREHYFLQLCLLFLPIRHENQAFRNR